MDEATGRQSRDRRVKQVKSSRTWAALRRLVTALALVLWIDGSDNLENCNLVGLSRAADAIFEPTKTTWTGKNCIQCLDAGRNHCELNEDSGICCDKGDSRCE